MSVCISARIMAELHQFFVHLPEVVTRWRCDALRTSGFVDDVMLS